MQESVFEVSVKGPGLSYEGKVDAEKAARVMAICIAGGNAVSANIPPQTTVDVLTNAADTLLGPCEYLQRFEPKRNPDKIVCFGAYLRDTKKQETFRREDVIRLFKQCGYPTPKNFSRDLKWAIKVGWIDAAPDVEDTFYVTNSGREAMQAKFSKEVLRKTALPAKLRRRKRKTGTLQEEA